MFTMNFSNPAPSKNRFRPTSLVSSWTNFSPNSLRPAGWWDASDVATITSGSGVASQWNDKSGYNGHFVQGALAFRPQTGTETQNGLNVLRFDGTDDGMVASASIITGKAFFSMFVVMKFNIRRNAANMFSLGGGGTGASRLLYCNDSSGAFVMTHDRFGGPALNHSSWDPEGPFHVFGFITNQVGGYPSSISVIRDRTMTTGNPGLLNPISSNAVAIATSVVAGAVPAPISVGEIVLFDRQISMHEFTLLTDYFNKKWRLEI